MHEAKFYKTMPNNSAQCMLCNHFCIIKKDSIGICGVRKNKNGKLYSLVYGYPIATNIDPIEKKPLFHFMPGSLTYSLGTLGCNYKCANCQNWDISQAKNIEQKIKKMDYISPEMIIKKAIDNECKSISYTYNEPTIFTEYALDIMKLARQYKLKNIWVSNGFMSKECINAILPYIDAINIDLKSMDDNFYKNNCSARLEPVLKNLKIFKEKQIHLEITTLIITGLSDSIEILSKISEFISNKLGVDTPWHISKFSPEISWKLKKIPETKKNIIYSAYEIGKRAGLKYIYVGNIPGNQKENTYCPSCGKLAIKRMGYYIERFDNKGLCSECGKNLDIIS